MIKITIDGEEVYSAKDFTIKEEMLNTPSVILNNVYPISWEQDRDYVSRFYHPNDYSKCLIMNNTHIPEEPGITVTSTSINADVDTSKKYEYSLMGDTKQNGTPTPDTPVAINTVTGGQTIKVTGKNLWGDVPTFTRTNAGYTATQNEDGTITLSGTSTTSGGSITFALAVDNGIYKKLPAGTYTISCDLASSNIWIQAYDTSDSSRTLAVAKSSTGASFTLSESANVFLRIWINGVGIVTDGTYKIQLEKGSKTSYEPYKSQTYEINLGKNLLNITNGTYSSNGITALVENGKITLNGTATANSFLTIPFVYQYNGTYTISANNEEIIGSTTTSGMYASVRINDNTDTQAIMGSKNATRTFTLNQKYNDFKIRTGQGLTYDNFVIYPQIEKGSQATSYSAYKTPIELCKINDYQDMIFKSTGNQLFDKDNFNSIDAYMNTSTLKFTISSTVKTYYITCKPNTTYTVQKVSGKQFRVGTSENIPVVNGDLLQAWQNNDATTYTITTDSNAKYLCINIRNSSTDTLAEQEILDSVMINEGTTALPYEPYNSKGKWLLHKEIGKVVLDGSESTATYYSYTYFWATTNYLRNDKGGKVYCSHFKGTANGGSTNVNLNAWAGNASTLCFRDNTKSSLAIWQEWLNNNNVTCYYMLGTPTYEEITDTELINQLESIELYNGTNNIMVSGYLPSPIQLHYNYVIEEDISDLLFCGVVKNSGYISLNPRHPHYQTLQILDFKTFLSEGETLDFVIANKTIEEAIEQVISTIAPYGFIKGNIQLLNSSDVIGAYSTKDKTAYDVFNYIADITQSRWTTRLIDENTVAIDFYDPTLLPQGSPINYTQNYFEQNLIDDVSYSYGSNDYRNKQVMTSSEVYGNILQTQTIVANGYQTQFDTELKIGKISSITINGVQMTFATTQEKELGYSADFYYTPGNNFFESADLRSTGQIIIISYLAIVEGRQIITNALEIDRVATSTGRKGVVARYEDRNDATTSTELQLIGQSYIKYKGVPEIKLSVTTRKNLWNIGDRVTFNAPITELATEYMVKKKEIQRVFANPSSEEVIFYKFELSSSFNMEQAINYFDNQRAKAKGNIGEGEYITRNVDIENISNVIFYDGTCEEITLVGDNTLNSILNSPFVN